MSQILYLGITKVPIGMHSRRTVILAADHRGYEMKQGLLDYLRKEKINSGNIGTYSAKRCDYPEISWKLGRMISTDLLCDTVGIGICGSGNGMSIPASKWSEVYATKCLTPDGARTSRKHNNSNLLALAADHLSLDEAIRIVDAWLWESFDPCEPYLSRFIQTKEFAKKVY